MEQSFKNHQQRTPMWIFGVLLPFTIYFIWSVTQLIREPGMANVIDVMMGIAFLLLWFSTRRMVLKVQDRVIRLEMRLRLREVLPPAMHGEIGRLPVRQLIALRFASDEELPELTKAVLAGTLTDGKQIKLKVRNWQGDYLRA
jgi:hypothetical protein